MNNSNINNFLSYFQITFFISLTFISTIKLKSDELLKIKSKIEENYYSFDKNKHINNIDLLNKLNINNEIKHYYLAFEYHNLGKIIYNENSNLALEYFEESIEEINKAIENIGKENRILLPEFYAILSSALGKKSSLTGFSSFYWGLKSQDAFNKAFNLDSSNNKIRLIGAIHLMHVPEFIGGDKKKARVVLNKLLFKEYKIKNKYEIEWAEKPEIFAYLAQIDILENNQHSRYIDSAYKYQPNYDFIKLDLLKQVEK